MNIHTDISSFSPYATVDILGVRNLIYLNFPEPIPHLIHGDANVRLKDWHFVQERKRLIYLFKEFSRTFKLYQNEGG